MSQYRIIVNPTSGRGNGEHIIPELKAHLSQHNIDYELLLTTGPGHAIELARQGAEAGCAVVVAVGGDGTANEVTNGLMLAQENGHNQTAMCALGAGRGNDFAYSLGLGTDLAAGCRALAADRRRRIDVGHVTGGLFPAGRYFDNSIGIGFDAVVGFEAAKMTRLKGTLSYLVAVLKTVFLYYRAPRVRLEFDGGTLTLSALMISFMNGQRQGGTFYMSPAARNDDSLLDICLVEEVSRPRIFTLIPHFFKGSQFSQKEIHLRQAAEIRVVAEDGVLPAHLDGETLSTAATELTIKLLPQRLEVVYQAGE